MTDRRFARAAGVLYLIVAIFGGLAELYVRASLIEPGDAGATAQNIRDSAGLFRFGFIADLFQASVFLLLAMALYVLLRRFGELAARAMVVFVAISVAIICLNLLNQLTALTIATGDSVVRDDAMVGLFTEMHANGYLIAQIFFGLWLWPLGYLALRSGWVPRALGWLLIVGAAGYIADTFALFVWPDLPAAVDGLLVLPSAVAELWMVLWLLVKAVPSDERIALTPATA
jgi:Domain of unknown function (DUF4386)